MGKNLSQLLLGALENLEKDPESRGAALKALKSYVTYLDSKTIPVFLERASEIKDLDCMISLFEILVRTQGRNIVPHINNIIDAIIKTLSSNAGSFALHNSCSKVVAAIARYGIDPLMLEIEKARIICSLCKPLSNLLMGSQESSASGAALCLTALVGSDNWRFASDDVVNEVCLRVAGALEETQTQTTYHMDLVTALVQHNSLIVDAYARSFIRSGLQILSADVKEENSQERLSATKMINFLMKCVDLRSISSEIAKIVDVLELSQNDFMPHVREAAFEALQTAKARIGQNGSWHEGCPSPPVFVGSNPGGRILQLWKDESRGYGDNDFPPELASLELQTADSLAEDDPASVSPLSLGQYSCNAERGRRTTRRLWHSFDVQQENGCCRQAFSSGDSTAVHSSSNKFRNGELSERHREHSEASSGRIQTNARNMGMRSSTPSPQRSRPQLVDNVKIFSTLRRLDRSGQNSYGFNFSDHERPRSRIAMTPASVALERNPKMVLNKANSYHCLNCVGEARVSGGMRKQSNQHSVQDADLATNDEEPPLCSEHTACSCKWGHKENGRVQTVTSQSNRSSKAAIKILCCIFMGFMAIILLIACIKSDEGFSDVVPT